MFLLDLTLPDPAQNLACDEALLDWCESDPVRQLLRFWQPRQSFVVVGYSNHVASEVNLETCAAQNIPVFRRCTGGGTVLQSPACLNYSLVLQIDSHPDLHSITAANRFIMERNRQAIESILGAPVTVQGHTDLTLGPLKFSGNAQRRRRRCLLFHGAFLLGNDPHVLDPISALLRMPTREPCYRQGRSHKDFLGPLNLPASRVRETLTRAWQAKDPLEDWPEAAALNLARSRYERDEWNFRS